MSVVKKIRIELHWNTPYINQWQSISIVGIITSLLTLLKKWTKENSKSKAKASEW